jgi:sugar/nucleoside kinase (ribokinase family)
MTIAVVGSINMDIVAFIDHYPRHGDTVFGNSGKVHYQNG